MKSVAGPATTGRIPMLTRRSIVLAPVLAGAVMPFNYVQADDYPSGPITIIVSFPAGGSLDVVVRGMAAKLQERLGKPVVVENRAGAGGVLATADVAKALPDGLTLLASASSLASNPTLFKSLPFDTLKDLLPLSLIFRTPLVLVVNPKLPVHSVAEFIALLKERPGQIDFGHGGPGSAIHLAAELFQTMTGTKLNAVSYRGAPLALNDVIGGHITAMFADAGSVTAQVNAGIGTRPGRELNHEGPGTAGCPHHCRGRRAWLRRRRLVADQRAGGNAETHRR